MASLGNWTIIFEDKMIIKQSGDGAEVILLMMIHFGVNLNFQIFGQFITELQFQQMK